MKKLLLISMLSIWCTTSFAQRENSDRSDSDDGFRVGAGIGKAFGDFGDWTSFALTVDAAYVKDHSDEFSYGAELGYTHLFGKDNLDDINFMHVAALGAYEISDNFGVEGAVGYAFGLGDFNEGGLYLRPSVYFNVCENIRITPGVSTIIYGSDVNSDDTVIGVLRTTFRF